MKVAVSGVNGFVGRHLVRELVGHGHEVDGLGLGPAAPDIAYLLADYHDVDLTKTWPDTGAAAVIHLAALSAVSPSFDQPQHYIEANSAPMTLLGELALHRPGLKLVVVSTGAVYGSPGPEPLSEDAELAPTSPYAVSKMLTEIQADYYRRRGADVVVMRPFNHIGPGQGPGFVLPDLLLGIRAWQHHARPLVVGNLATRRDYTDVRDVARAYRLAVEADRALPAVLNVCSGASRSGRSLLEALVRAMQLDIPDVVLDSTRIRPNDPEAITGDNSAIRASLGWAPNIELDQTVMDILTHNETTMVE